MKIDISETYETMSRKAADFIVESILQKPDSLLCLPAGDSPAGVFRHLVADAKNGKVDFSRCRFVGLDEWVGLRKEDSGSCGHCIYSAFFEPLQIPESHICFFDACADDLKAECRRVDSHILANGPLDLIMLGIGMNGHIAFNEPGVDLMLNSHVAKLDRTTTTVGQKYFSGHTFLDQGITLGMKHIMEASVIILIANSAKKAEIVKRAVAESPTSLVPASILQSHKKCFFFLDREAASGLVNMDI